MPNIDLTPALLSMQVIARNKTAVYLRLPAELQRETECSCEQCKGNPALAKWDTLCVPTVAVKGQSDYCHTVHMPDGSVQAFIDYCKRRGL